MTSTFVYKGFIQSQIAALNAADWQKLTRAEDFSDDFVKHMFPMSMNVPKQTRTDWYTDLTTGFVAENYEHSTATLTKYWENVHERSAIAWINEKGRLTSGDDYDIDYLMRYEFDEDGKVAELYEYNDSKFQIQVANQWKESLQLEKSKLVSRRFFLLSYPRTASSLLMKMMNMDQQTKFAVNPSKNGTFFFMDALDHRSNQRTWDRHSADWTDFERSTTAQSFQDGALRMKNWIKKAESEGKSIFIKEHVPFMAKPSTLSDIAYGHIKEDPQEWTVSLEGVLHPSSSNGTILPDEFLRTFCPTFLIRHPALTIPSQYRTFIDIEGIDDSENQKGEFKAMVSIAPVRRLYDWFCSQRTGSEDWPIVLEANDLIQNPTIVIKYASRLHLTEPVQTCWSAATEEEKQSLGSASVQRMKSTLIASTGVLQEKAPVSLDLKTESEKWDTEFGRKAGKMIESLVMGAIPDYEYLSSKRLKVSIPR